MLKITDKKLLKTRLFIKKKPYPLKLKNKGYSINVYKSPFYSFKRIVLNQKNIFTIVFRP